MFKKLLFSVIFLSSLTSQALETRVLEFKYSLYGSYSFADSILYSGTEGSNLGEKWLSDEHPHLTDSLSDIQVNRLDIASGAPVFGADVWYFMRPDFAWTLGLTVDAPREVVQSKFDNNLLDITKGSDLEDVSAIKDLFDSLNDAAQGAFQSYQNPNTESLLMYKFSLYGVHLGGALTLVKKMVFSAALSYYYIAESYNDINAIDMILFSPDFNLSSRIGFRVGGGWFFTDHIALGVDYRYVSLNYELKKDVQSENLLSSLVGSVFDKDIDDYFDSYNRDLSGSLSGIEVYIRYFF